MATILNGEQPDYLVHILNDHVHSPQQVYPTLAGGVPVLGGAAWTLGAFVEIVPINTIASPFDIHWVFVENATADSAYELVLYEAAVERARVRFTRDVAGASTEPLISVPCQTVLFAPNSQVQAKLASAAGGPDTGTVSIGYHTY